jgi:endonuclease/exonuclease/phosphatase (EEP) superfamily protein YafD
VQILDSGDSDIIALLSVGGQQLCCASLRLTPPPSRLDFWRPEFWIAHQELRNRHRAELSFLMKQLEQTADGLPVIVGGDMNAVPQDRAFDVLRSRLQDSFDRSGLGWGATGTNEWPLFRVDQIWTGSQVHSIRTWAKKTKCSDHRMVICDFILQ